MGRSLNTLKGSDVTATPIKLKYSNQIPSASLSSNSISLTVASNQSFDYNNPSYGGNFLLYRSVQGLYYKNYVTGSLLGSASAYEWYPQSTAASGTFDDDYRYFPTASDAQILVISIPRAKYGENVARASFSISSDNFNIIDDGNGNLVDTLASNTHVGNLLYNQGIGIVTNYDYINAFFATPVVPPSPPITTDLILSLFSDYGVIESGGDVSEWTDLSGVGNYVTNISAKPELVSSVFGTKPSVRINDSFSGLKKLRTPGNLIGLNGSSACTVFMVAKIQDPGLTGGDLIEFTNTEGSVPVAGNFLVSVYNGGDVRLAVSMSGNSGVNTGNLKVDADTPYVFTFDMDYSKSAIAELKGFRNNDDTLYTQDLPLYENTNTFTNAQLTIGYKPGNLDIGCILIYKSSLNNSDRTTVYNYLSSYFSIP